MLDDWEKKKKKKPKNSVQPQGPKLIELATLGAHWSRLFPIERVVQKAVGTREVQVVKVKRNCPL